MPDGRLQRTREVYGHSIVGCPCANCTAHRLFMVEAGVLAVSVGLREEAGRVLLPWPKDDDDASQE